ncbi:M16 family metallopeptidase [Acuticoccus mangrovi]|uniref:Insulinase family protein n=1 Tax=Acuticoccus mangrovi TaxID=2796142 RepID=A0A934IL36_9HYPH|nr:pitrilysin family protein [Acuticoccus mangrovi]MBJ3778624.1 insulinase family protein [Acuticoccus mangrovi]
MMTLPATAKPVDLSDLTIAPDATTFSLDNGLQVVVIPDRRAPIVTHMVWYRIGAADEPPGKSGIAHYLEHLMFKGTSENPGSTFSDTVARVGGRENAFTSNDYTGYYQQVSKQNLPQMMALEADRMRNLRLTHEVSAPELKVVLEERRARIETRPSAELGEAVDAALFINHPYSDPIIGWPNEVASLTFEDALNFYRSHYRPGNAVLVIAGDVDVDEIRTLAEETYGKIADDKGRVTRVRPQAQKLRADRLVELADPRVTQSSTQLAWLVPSYTTAEPGTAEALDVLAEILGGNNTSRLYTALVRDEKIATSAGAWYQSSAIDDTRFVFYAIPRGDTSLEALEDRAREIIADIADNGVSDEELQRAKTSLLASAIFAQDNQASLARIFGAALATGSTVEEVQTWPTAISAITADDVRAAAKTWLDDQATVTGRLLEADAPATAAITAPAPAPSTAIR